MLATRLGDPQMARMLIAQGADVDLATSNGVSALVIAAMQGHIETATILLEAGADYCRVYNGNMVPWQVAAANKHHKLSVLLREFEKKPKVGEGQS